MMASLVTKHSVTKGGSKTSVSLEQDFWDALKEIAKRRDMSVHELIETIDYTRETGNLSSTLRLFVLAYYQNGQRQAAPMPNALNRQG